MSQPLQIGDKNSALFEGLTAFWTRFFRDSADLQAFYSAAELYIGEAYLEMLEGVLHSGLVDFPIFSKEYWRLWTIREDELDFVEGVSIAEDRFRFDMPGDSRCADFLQNSIFSPTVLYERGVDFDVNNLDGYARFVDDPFRGYVDPETGTYMPKQGMNWRSIDISVGNQFRDVERGADWRIDSEVKSGDTLRLLAQTIDIRVDDVSHTGQIFYGGGAYRFYSPNPDLQLKALPGDVVEVKNSGTSYDGFYVVKSIPGVPGYVELEETFYAPLVTSPATLDWRLYKMSYFDSFQQDFPIAYIDVLYLVGHKDTPYPLTFKEPLVYSVVRDVAEPDVIGLPVSPTVPTNTGYTHIVPGSLVIHALRNDGQGKIREDEDYTVDYLRGWIYPVAPPSGHWDPLSMNTANFQYRHELVKAAGGSITERIEGRVKQLAFWVPEVIVDRFNLYKHYGFLLNRFEASSETYKTFLRGVMHLYEFGPIFDKMQSGMNIVAGYPVIRTDGELLTGYTSGIDAQDATDGQIVGLAKTFTTGAGTYTFTELDVGGYLIFPNALSAFNKGRFRILSLVDSQTVLLESAYPMVDETPIEWILSRNYQHVVMTDRYTYTYPFFVPMRSDVTDPALIGTLTFKAFESLTEAFTVTDYVEAPLWWVGKTLPYVFFPTANLTRRVASDQLFKHVFDPDDSAMYDDPGLYYDGDDEGHVTATPYRHNVGFILFDRFLKAHMFYVAISPDLELPATFKDDFEDLVLITKPAYTYPYVEPNEPFLDEGMLWDDFKIAKIKMCNRDDIGPSPNELRYDAETELAYGDYFRYVEYWGVVLPVFPYPPLPFSFALPILPGERPLVVNVHVTVGGNVALEGVDYEVDYDPTSPTAFQVTALTTWDAVPGTLDILGVAIVNLSTTPIPDTTIGFTPLAYDTADPAYVRQDMHVLSAQTENVSRPVSLKIDADGMGTPYIYP